MAEAAAEAGKEEAVREVAAVAADGAPATGTPATSRLHTYRRPSSQARPAMCVCGGVCILVAAGALGGGAFGAGAVAKELGNNENAARYSGINTDNLKILAYVACSTVTGLAGVLFGFELNSVQPASTGEFYELYAIAAAVLGGCSLRGGEGSVLGVIIAAAVIRLLYNSINMLGISTHLEYAIIGGVILAGVVTDELVKRYALRRRAARALLPETAS